jgi:F-type H+-transporting ATPase subunit b
MSGLLSSLGIEWKSLIAQLINFGILVFVLWKLVYKPILKVLDDRAQMAKDAAEKSSSIESKMEEMKLREEEILAKARASGEKLVKDAEGAAANLKKKLSDEATVSAQKIVNDAEARMRSENEKFQSELKKEIVSIVASAIEATVGKYLDRDAKHKLAEEASKEALKVEAHIK